MSFSVRCRCLSCDYESDLLGARNGRTIIAICSSCNSVVNPEIIPFRFELPHCPLCETPVPQSGLLDGIYVTTECVPDMPSKYSCPRCQDGFLAFTSARTPLPTVRYPTEAAVVHGMFRGNELIVPGFCVPRDDVDIEDLPKAVTDQPMEFVVVHGEDRDGNVKLTLRFTRFLALVE